MGALEISIIIITTNIGVNKHTKDITWTQTAHTWTAQDTK